MSPLHLASGKMWGNIQQQIQRESVSSWIPLGLFMWEMKSLYNTSMILTFSGRDKLWIAAFSRGIFTRFFSSHADSEYLEAALESGWSSPLSMLSNGKQFRASPHPGPSLLSSFSSTRLTSPAPPLQHRRWFQSFAQALIFKGNLTTGNKY